MNKTTLKNENLLSLDLLIKTFDDLSIGVGIFQIPDINDLESIRYVFMNKMLLYEMRKTKEEVFGKRIIEVAPEAYQHEVGVQVIETYFKVVAEGGSINLGLVEYSNDMVAGTYECSAHHIQDNLIYVMLRNVTEIEQIKNELELKNKKLKQYSSLERRKFSQTVKYSPIPTMIHKDGKVLALSDEWIRLTGYTINDMPTIEEWSRKVYRGELEPSKESIEELNNLKGVHNEGIWNIKNSDGEILIWQFHSGPIGDKTIISAAIDITEAKQKEQLLKDNLEEKEVLLGEVHHRVKNNLAIISGMLELQAFTSENTNEINELTKSVNRIKSIANIHEQLYKTGDFRSISISDSIKTHVDSLASMYDNEIEVKVNLIYDLENVSLSINQAVPIGLLINELSTNALKYAFKGVIEPELKISLKKIDNEIVFSIQDNGVGFDVDEFNDSDDSLGHSLIEAFVSQLEGSLDIKSNSKNGTNFTIRFIPILKKGGYANTLYN